MLADALRDERAVVVKLFDADATQTAGLLGRGRARGSARRPGARRRGRGRACPISKRAKPERVPDEEMTAGARARRCDDLRVRPKSCEPIILGERKEHHDHARRAAVDQQPRRSTVRVQLGEKRGHNADRERDRDQRHRRARAHDDHIDTHVRTIAAVCARVPCAYPLA